ncbi:hypothetical protein [Stygiolobus caldivivus]|uniref:Uncharacterized protein n=1 Tax=Stygiolobus caldivivus TaxID=2824673 RepID=A0A8D5U6V5_9CREN|nr:hypothetical protein [Stygiolobus caldivivus]BCU70145.1 hypothetical protein KN1_14420 [Stygiolobus caldivivus]
MTIIVRKTHEKDGKRIYIRVGESPPAVKEGKIKDGAFFIIVGDDDGEKQIRLTDQEALDIAQRIMAVYHLHVKIYRKLDKKTYQEYKERMRVPESDEKLENDIIRFLIRSGGEATVKDIRDSLGVKHADYLHTMEKYGLVIVDGDKVILNMGRGNTHR